MRRTEPELAAVRELADELAGQPSTARTWAKIVNGQSSDAPAPAPARLSRRREGLAVGTVAAAVVALAVTVTLVLRPGAVPETQIGTAPSPGGASVPTEKVPPTSAPPTTSSVEAPTIKGTLKTQPASLSTAINAMVKASKRAPTLPMKPGQFLYIRVDAFDRVHGTWEPRTQDWWTDLYAVKKPNLDQPSATYLASLPTDPAKLYDRFAALNAGVKLGGDHYVTKQVFSALRQYGPLVKPAVRAAFYQVLGLVQGETAVTVKLDGHTYYGFRDLATSVGDFYLLCDPATGMAIGEAYDATLIELWNVAVVDADGEVP